MAPAAFEPAIPASARPYNHALDRAAPVVSILYISLEFRCILFQLTHEVDWVRGERGTRHILFGKLFYTIKKNASEIILTLHFRALLCLVCSAGLI